MNKTININGSSYARIIYKDEPVVTIPMVAELHERSQQTVRQNFLRNQERFVDGKDYFSVPYSEWKDILVISKRYDQTDSQDNNPLPQDASKTIGWPKDENKSGGHRGHMIFLTQLGYLKLIKTFNDDLAWDIYIQVVEHYFLTRVAMGNRRQPNPEYVGWLKEQRMSMGEERRFQEFALAEADRLIRIEGSVADLAHVPLLQDAVAAIMRTDPRSKQKQLGLFGD